VARFPHPHEIVISPGIMAPCAVFRPGVMTASTDLAHDRQRYTLPYRSNAASVPV